MDDHPSILKDDYVYGVDIVRFLAALAVAAFHLTWRVPAAAWTLPIGWIGVQVFFVISGLVIANSAQSASPSRFVTSRFLRLYPAAWCVAVISTVTLLATPHRAYPAFGIDVSLGATQFLHSVLLIGRADSFLAGAYWTLPIEIPFYSLIFGLLLLKRFAHIRWIAIALIIGSTPYLIGLFLHSIRYIDWPWIDLGYGLKNMSLLRHGPYFSIGIFIWLWKDGRLKGVDKFAAVFAFGLTGLEIHARSVDVAPKFLFATGAPSVSVLFLTTLAVICFSIACFSIFAAVSLNRLFPQSRTIRRTVRLVGLLTYPYYLLHETVGGSVLYALASLGIPFYLNLIVALSCIGAIALLVAAYAEPLMRRRLHTFIAAIPSRIPKMVRAA